MKNLNLKHIITFLVICCITFTSNNNNNNLLSQELMTTSIANNPKSLFVNPALSPAKNNFWNLPILGSFNAKLTNNFSFSDITDKQNNGDYRINTNKLLNSLSGDNDFFAGGYSLDIIHLGMAVRENDYISLSFRNRFSAAGSLPRDLAELVLDNPYDKYKTFDISSTFKFIMWNELGLSYSYKFNDNWQLGGRLKYLSGVINAETEKLSYTIDKYYDYYLLSSDVNLRSNVGSSSSSSNNDWFDPVDFNPIGYFFSNNFSDAGIGIDVGAKYQTTDKRLTANASISDLGMIFWNERNSINTITLNPNNKLRFEGFGDLEQTFNSGADFTTLFDSVDTEFKRTIGIAEVEDYSYSSSLPTLFQASGTYSIDDKFSHNVSLGFAGRLVMSEKFHYAISAGYHWFSDSKRWQLLANYTYYGNSANGFGLGAVYNAKKFQVYVVANNIVPLFSPLSSKFIGFDIGICFFNQQIAE